MNILKLFGLLGILLLTIHLLILCFLCLTLDLNIFNVALIWILIWWWRGSVVDDLMEFLARERESEWR